MYFWVSGEYSIGIIKLSNLAVYQISGARIVRCLQIDQNTALKGVASAENLCALNKVRIIDGRRIDYLANLLRRFKSNSQTLGLLICLPSKSIGTCRWTVPAWPCPLLSTCALASTLIADDLAFLVFNSFMIAASKMPTFDRPPLRYLMPTQPLSSFTGCLPLLLLTSTIRPDVAMTLISRSTNCFWFSLGIIAALRASRGVATAVCAKIRACLRRDEARRPYEHPTLACEPTFQSRQKMLPAGSQRSDYSQRKSETIRRPAD